jgi:ligand-binding SRPBCC domain-containing protein
MRVYGLRSAAWVARPLGEVFEFHADAGNLQALTPPWLDFQILTPRPIDMRAGALIEYRLRLRGVPIRWLTEITEWAPPSHFVDIQRRGPYQLWHHRHEFEEKDGGTEIRDEVRYAVPFGMLVHRWLVAPDVRRIFAYRHHALLKIFGGAAADQPPRIEIALATAQG